MEPSTNVVPRIEAEQYEDFRAIVDTLPSSFEAWCQSVAQIHPSPVNYRAVRPIQFQEYVKQRCQSAPTIADLYRCARFLWNRDVWRSDW